MADKTAQTIYIDADPATVMDVIADIGSYPDWVAEYPETEVLDVYADGYPKTARMVLDATVLKDTMVFAYQWPADRKSVSWSLVSSTLLKALEGTYRLSPKGSGTEVTYELSVDLMIPMIGLLKRKAERRLTDTALKDLKKRLEQAAGKTSILLLKSASGSIAEICARTLQTPKTPWLDLSASSAPLTQEMLENASGGILFVADLMLLGKLQQKNLAFALDRLDKYKLQLVAAHSRALVTLEEAGWDPGLVARLGEVWVSLPQLSGHADEVPEVAALILAHLVERKDVPPRVFSSGALNGLRLHHWQGEWGELLATVRNLALSALDEEIAVEDVESILLRDAGDAPKAPPALPLFNKPLREAREEFERLYFEHHLKLERGNMTRVADKTGLERTHLYRKLKQLGLNLVRRGEDHE